MAKPKRKSKSAKKSELNFELDITFWPDLYKVTIE